MRAGTLTAVLLRRHLQADDVIKVLQPIQLLRLCLTGEQKTALGRHYGDAMLPGAVALSAGR